MSATAIRQPWQKALPFLLVVVVVIAFLAYDTVRTYTREITFTQRNNENIARLLNEHLSATLGKLDTALDGAVAELGPQLERKPASEINARLQHILAQIPESQSLRIVGADGNVLYDASGTPPKGNIADRAYFQRNRDDPNAGLVISEPIFARFTSNWVITLSRQFRSPDGQFRGLIQAAVRAEYFSHFYDTLNMGEHGLIGLVNADFILFVRQPNIPESIGRSLANAEFAKRILAGQHSGHYTSNSKVDSVERLHYYRTASDYPFVFVVATAQSEVMAELRWKAGVYILFALLLFAAIHQLLKAWRHRHREAQNLAEEMTQAFHASAGRAQALLDGLPDPAWFADSTGRIDAANESFIRRFAQGQAVHGHQLADIWNSPHAEALTGLVQTAISTGQSQQLNLDYPSQAGTIHYQFVLSPVRGKAQEILGVAALARDLTTIHQAAEATEQALLAAEASNRAKRDFLATTSHELRTPLSGILGMSELIDSSRLDDEARLCIHDIHDSAQRLMDLIDNILIYAQLDAGNLKLHEAACKPRAILADMEQRFHAAARSRGLSFSTSLDEEVPAQILADRTRIEHILHALLDNAIKFTRHGQVSLHIALQPARQDERIGLRFLVRDTGIGIPESFRATLFTAFTQAESSTRRSFEGAGLSLALSHKLAQLMDGQLDYQSGPEGSCFWLDVAAPMLTDDDRLFIQNGALDCCQLGNGAHCAALDSIIRRCGQDQELGALVSQGMIDDARRALDTPGTTSERLEECIDQLSCPCLRRDLTDWQAHQASDPERTETARQSMFERLLHMSQMLDKMTS